MTTKKNPRLQQTASRRDYLKHFPQMADAYDVLAMVHIIEEVTEFMTRLEPHVDKQKRHELNVVVSTLRQ